LESDWTLQDDIQAELSKNWFDQPEVRAELQLDPDMIRQDFTMKSNQGYLGQIKDNEGYTMTEQSIDIDGIHMPLIVPTLNKEEIAAIKAGEEDTPTMKSAYKKAEDHAKQRIKEGKSPFFEDKPQSITLESDEVPINKDTSNQRLDKIDKLLEAKGYSPQARAGIIGNIKQESKDVGNKEANSYNYNTKQAGGGPGIGIFQMEKQRNKNKEDLMYDAYEGWLKRNNKQDSIESQIDFMDDVVQGKDKAHTKIKGDAYLGAGNAKKLKQGLANAKTPEEAAKIFMEIFENPGEPHLENRINYANEYYESN
jgi:hypothetical protein